MDTKATLTPSRRRFLGYLGVGAAGLGLAACGAAPAKSTSAVPGHSSSSDLPDWLKSKAKGLTGKTLNVIGSEQYFQTTNNDFVNACKTFGQITGNTVNATVLNIDTGNIVSREDAAVKAGNPPDCAFIDPSRFAAQFYQLGDIQPVNQAMSEMISHYGDPVDVNKIYLTLGPNKDWYGIPYFSLINGWFARKDWLDQKGIKASEFAPGKIDLNKLRDMALEISDPSQQRYGWGITFNNSGDGTGAIEWVLNTYGSGLNDDSGTKVIFGAGKYAEPTEEAVSWLVDTYSSPKYSKMLPPGVLGWTDTGNNEAWLAGTVGFTENAYSLYAQSKASGNPVYHETLLFNGPIGPAMKAPPLVGSSEAFVIFKGAKEPELATILAQYLAYGEPLLQMVKQSVGLVLPAYENIWNSNPFYLNGDPAFKSQHAQLDIPLPIATTTGLHFPQTANAGSDAVGADYILNDMLGSIVNKKATMKQAIATARQRMITTYEENGLPQ
ncbi:MAG: ABC transporter substrate-binding protein [Candidatus Dormibacteraceae bacterium]